MTSRQHEMPTVGVMRAAALDGHKDHRAQLSSVPARERIAANHTERVWGAGHGNAAPRQCPQSRHAETTSRRGEAARLG
jgi:hypothetical protein